MNHSPLWTPERQLAQTGLGELRRFELYPGMELAMTSFHGERVQLEHEPLADVLEINYCRKGRIGWSMRDGMSVYLGPGDLELHTMDRCAVSAITLPLGYYEGITLTLDAGRLERDGLWFFRESGIGCPALAQKLCPGGRPLALPANTELARIFDPLYTVSERLWRTCCKLKALELLLYLDEFVPERERQLGQYRSSQVDTIKEIHALLTADLRQQLSELLDEENRRLWSAVLYGIYSRDDVIVKVALSQAGNVGGEPYWSWYGFNSRVEWCACFVSWCFNECGYLDTGTAPKFAGCVGGVEWFRSRGQWADNTVNPAPGMIVFFDWNDPNGASGPQDGEADHVGIVEKCENGIVYTIEGNSGDACRQNQDPVGYYEILGYGVPKY